MGACAAWRGLLILNLWSTAGGSPTSAVVEGGGFVCGAVPCGSVSVCRGGPLFVMFWCCGVSSQGRGCVSVWVV